MKMFTVAFFTMLALPIQAWAAEITIKISETVPDEGTATLKLNTVTKSWTGTNDSGTAVFKILSGDYVVAPANTFPGYATKGTALVKKGGSATKSDDIDSVLANFIPTETVSSGEIKAFKAGLIGRWRR